MPISTINPTTRLEAINEMLLAIGEAPVNQLGEEFEDSRIAEKFLDAMNRRVQSRGWPFNSEYGYTLHSNNDGFIEVPGNCLKIDTGCSQYVQRGSRIYDRYNHTYSLEGSLSVDMVVAIDFEELPQPARDFITIAAGRQFQQKVVGSQGLDGFAREDERLAWIELRRLSIQSNNRNLFRSPDMARRLDRSGSAVGDLYSPRNLRGY